MNFHNFTNGWFFPKNFSFLFSLKKDLTRSFSNAYICKTVRLQGLKTGFPASFAQPVYIPTYIDKVEMENCELNIVPYLCILYDNW